MIKFSMTLLSITTLSIVSFYESRVFIVMLNVIMLNAIMLSVVAPKRKNHVDHLGRNKMKKISRTFAEFFYSAHPM